MNLFRALLAKQSLLWLALSFSNVGYAEKVTGKDWQQYIPVTGQTIQAEVMEIMGSTELEKLTAKVGEGLRKNPEWALEFVGSVPKGQPLPYHENLGLTKQEYAQMMELIEKGEALILKKTGTIDLTFEPLPDGKVKIRTNQNSILSNLIISDNEVETSFGKLTDVKEINNQDPKAIAGPWKGIKWSRNTLDPKSMQGESIQFCIGRRADTTNPGIIYYDGKMLTGSLDSTTQFSQVFLFPASH